ncbi:PQQ-binding-like beta-propeller repeat protein [Streptomyces sp. Ag109_O5-1]|uniref:PQQ-binding-like beta-propeller repeat protein n=1 Tax=Streptomyces sp. Ag109_O5-1 TaxID=1938851 RepID=UPI000F4ECFC4|nr:PQQ-binding-like beta-propeller repeat protein [Streptomyces sp. Ag109_O5-1]
MVRCTARRVARCGRWPAGHQANATGRRGRGEGNATAGIDVDDRTLWRVPGGGVLHHTSAMADGAVYVLQDFFDLVAVDAGTGERRWTLRSDSGIASSPVADAGVVYFADTAGYLTAVDAATGDVRWKWRSRRSKMSMPTVADGIVYAAHHTRMWAVDGVTGRPVWDVRVADQGTVLNPPTVAHGVLYAADGGHLLALDTATGSRRWDVFPHGGVQQTPTVADGSVYVANREGLVALDSATGEQRWRTSPGGTVWASPAVAEGIAVAGVHGWYLIAVDAETGRG